MLHTPQAGKTNRIRTKRPLYQDGGAHCAAQENHGRFDQPSTLQTPVLDCFAWSDLGGDEPRLLWNHAILEVTPQRNEQSPRQRNDADAAHAQAPAGEASLVPLAERALGLEAQPQPGDLDHHGPHPAVARLADALVALAVSAVVGRAHQARKSRHFTPVAKAPPAEELHHQQPGAGRPDRPQAHQLHDAALGIGLRFAQPLAALRLKRGDLALDQRKALYLAFKLAAQLPGQRAPVPQGERLQPQVRGALAPPPDALHHQQLLNPRPMPKPLALQALQFTVKAPGVLLL